MALAPRSRDSDLDSPELAALTNYIRDRKCVLFVGAGLSRAAGLPDWGALMRAVRPDSGRLPAAVTLPEHIWNDGNFPWPGQDAGVLGPQYDPWLITCDPSAAEFRPPALALPSEVA